MEKPYSKEYLQQLAHKYRNGTITEEEQIYFDEWYNHFQHDSLDLSGNAIPQEQIREEMLANIQNHVQQHKTSTLFIYRKYAAIAAVLMVCAAAVYLLRLPGDTQQTIPVAETQVQPGINGAVLTLANGENIILEQANTGTIRSEGSTIVQKANDSLLIYAAGKSTSDEISYNTLETPRGRQYAILLPDGSKIWLNAASSLKYPTAFTGKQRVVSLTGEAYFEIAKDKSHPFIVKSGDQAVTVLGTHFNINSYADEGKIVTTLLEGSVMVQAGREKKLIKPGYQTVLLKEGTLSSQQANAENTVAWTNSKMVFEDAGVPEIMRQVARWYDLDIQYEGKIPDDTFSGTISRKADLSTVLKMFALSEIKFRIEQNGNRKKLIIKT